MFPPVKNFGPRSVPDRPARPRPSTHRAAPGSRSSKAARASFSEWSARIPRTTSARGGFAGGVLLEDFLFSVPSRPPADEDTSPSSQSRICPITAPSERETGWETGWRCAAPGIACSSCLVFSCATRNQRALRRECAWRSGSPRRVSILPSPKPALLKSAIASPKPLL